MKVKVKFKDGTTGEVYEHEKYRLVKRGMLEISKEEQKKYDELFANEPAEKNQNQPLGKTQYDRIRKVLASQEKEIETLKGVVSNLEKELKKKPETKERKQKPQTK